MLKGRRYVGRWRGFRPALLLDVDDLVGGPFELLEKRVDLGLRADLELGPLALARPADEAALEAEVVADLGEGGVDRPRLDRDKGADLRLTVDDQSQRHRLDTAGADALLDLAPEERAEPVADQAVDDPTRLLGVDEVHVDVAR